jgi:predicted DNA-binding ribbon-helix-helix protein
LLATRLRLEGEMTVVKRSIIITGHKTSISLEDAFWNALKDIAVARRSTPSELISCIDSDRQGGNLSSAVRVFVLDFHLAGGGIQPSKEIPTEAPFT